jgi:hypothetical protein
VAGAILKEPSYQIKSACEWIGLGKVIRRHIFLFTERTSCIYSESFLAKGWGFFYLKKFSKRNIWRSRSLKLQF